MQRILQSPAVASSLLVAIVALSASLSGCAASGSAPADPDLLAERANAVGIAPDLVYTTTLDGFILAPQSVNPGAGTGLSAVWTKTASGALLQIRTERGELTAESCPEQPLIDMPPEAPVTCTDEDGIWHRTAGAVHEYVAVRDGALIRLTGTNVQAAELLAAAKAVHVPSASELDLLFSDLPDAPGGPVDRGDIPEDGDGAPLNPTGPGG